MKVQLIVVQGKPEGKVIPLAGPEFRIGRGEKCHLRPNSELVSREHALFAVHPDRVTVKDLGSRNGTVVNGKAIKDVTVLKDRDLIQVGHLTFAISIEGMPAASATATASPAPAAAPLKPRASIDEDQTADIESWLIADNRNPTPERPSGVYGGDTLSIKAYQGQAPGGSSDRVPAAGPAPEPEADGADGVPEGADEEPEAVEELIDESNPFFVKKKAEGDAPAKPVFQDTSDAASEILRKMLERRRSQKSQS